MRLTAVKIENFRGIDSLEIQLGRDVTVLVGENNCGKTSALEAIRFGLDTIKSDSTCNFHDFDFFRTHADQGLQDCEPIELTFLFVETDEHQWSAEVIQSLAEVIVGDEHSIIKLQVKGWYDADEGELRQEFDFLDNDDNPIAGRRPLLKELRRLRPFFFMSALRAAKDEFHGQATFWSSFLNNKDIDDTTRTSLESELDTVYRKVIEAHQSFGDVVDEVKKLGDLVAVGGTDAVTVDPAPPDVYKALRMAQVSLVTEGNAKVPLRSHGEGTQSLSVLLLFSSYLKTRLQIDVDRLAIPIVAIEEPEAHLHPNASRALWPLLHGLPGQKIIATHSGDILSEVPVSSLRRLSRNGASTDCLSLSNDLLDADELRKFNHHVRRNRGELLFARCWLMVEGETDVTVISECASVLSIRLQRRGVRLIEYTQVGAEIFLKVANALGIEWFVVADGDSAGDQYVTTAEGYLCGRERNDHIFQLPYDNMDILLCCSGYGAPYELGIHEDKRTDITAVEGTDDYWKQAYGALKKRFSKPAAALDAVLGIKSDGPDHVPAQIRSILESAIARAEG